MVALPTLKQLRHLVELADHRHFGRAAGACHITQSTLSASIKELEEVLQAALVDRTKRKVVLTPLGQETVERAQQILKEVEELAQAAQAAREPLSGILRMGVIPTVGPFLLPRVLPKLRRAYPKLGLYLIEDLTARLVEQLHTGKLDVLLVALPYDCGNVEVAELFDDHFYAALRREHPLATSETISPAQLTSENLLLLQDGHCLRDHALSACRLTDRHHVVAFEATSLYTLVQMVDNGLGITLLPQLAIDAGILRGTGLTTREIAVQVPSRRVGLVWRKGTRRREEFQILARELRRLIGAPPLPARRGRQVGRLCGKSQRRS